MDGRVALAGALIFATLIGAWMFRDETVHPLGHRNRFTGVMCHPQHECWLQSADGW